MVTRFSPALGPLARRRRRRSGTARVTVIIPTYNWPTVLPYSIGSVRAQTVSDWELLVIGDGCTDESEEVVRAIDDPRISWFNLRNNGKSQVGPNNLGLALAGADLIAYCGHDDLWFPDHLETLLGSGAGFVHASQLRVEPGRTPFVSPEPHWRYTSGDWLPPTSFMHPRTAAVRAGGWRFPVRGQWNDPEADLCQRISRRIGSPHHVRRVTSLKMSAALRKNVYRERPCDEQAFWWARIQAAPNSEAFVADAIANPDLVPPSRYRFEDASPASLGAPGYDAVERRRITRILKGLDD